jgi:hypothetical protein
VQVDNSEEYGEDLESWQGIELYLVTGASATPIGGYGPGGGEGEGGSGGGFTESQTYKDLLEQVDKNKTFIDDWQPIKVEFKEVEISPISGGN